MACYLRAGNHKVGTATLIQPRKKSRFCQVRAQSYRDEGKRSNSNVDANLHVLRERMEAIKMKEKLAIRWCVGWNYAPLEISMKAKRDEELLHFIRLMAICGATFGLTLLTGSFFLCITSLFLHLNQ